MKLFDVRPSFAADNALHVRHANVECLSDGFTRYADRSHMANCAHLVISQFCIAVLLAFGDYIGVLLECGALLRRHIGHVIAMCSQEQVIGPNTRMVITAMQYPEVVGDWAIVNKPRSPMRSYDSPLVAELPIAIRWIGALPIPAGFRLVDLCPKARNFCGRIIHVGTPNRTTGHAPGCSQQRGGFVLFEL